MNNDIKWLIKVTIFSFIVIAILSWISRTPRDVPEERVVYDTIVKVDTIFVEKPVTKDSIVLRTEKVYVDKLVVDTLRDTMFVEIPITQKKYETESYRAYVSGFRPSLDSLYIYNRETLVERTIKPKRWSFGLSAGYGITPKGFQPYIGVSLNYRLK